uniref:Helitron helicase-like domain-containing protein n=1 Tax=Anopheles albimanus TaxID=7167 RepID=A0A182FMP7_ANOAL
MQVKMDDIIKRMEAVEAKVADMQVHQSFIKQIATVEELDVFEVAIASLSTSGSISAICCTTGSAISIGSGTTSGSSSPNSTLIGSSDSTALGINPEKSSTQAVQDTNAKKAGLGDLDSYTHPPPSELRELFRMPAFLSRVRVYNNVFAFTSLGASVRPDDPVRQDETVAGAGGVYSYRIQGALCHRIGGLGQHPDRTPMYAQLYFYDAHDEIQRNRMVDARMEYSTGLDRSVVATLQRVLEQHNPLAAMFRHAFERMTTEENVELRIHGRIQGLDHRRYNRPTADEIGGIFVCTEQNQSRDIVLQNRTTLGLHRVFESHQLFEALQYPLLHLYGEARWSYGIAKQPRRDGRNAFQRVGCSEQNENDPEDGANTPDGN